MTAEELRARYEADLKALQDSFPHEKSTVMPYMWAPGHVSGIVTVCDKYEKVREDKNELR